MPIYEFACVKCGNEFEALVPRPGAKSPCPECGGKRVKQKISAPAGFSIKGSAPAVCPSTGGPAPEQCGQGG